MECINLKSKSSSKYNLCRVQCNFNLCVETFGQIHVQCMSENISKLDSIPNVLEHFNRTLPTCTMHDTMERVFEHSIKSIMKLTCSQIIQKPKTCSLMEAKPASTMYHQPAVTSSWEIEYNICTYFQDVQYVMQIVVLKTWYKKLLVKTV